MPLGEYLKLHPNPQAGPCAGCGATGYGLSMGGPSICPACDCLPPERRVKHLAEENRMLRERVAELEQWAREGWGHSGPCAVGCTCDAARAARGGT